MPKQAAGLSFTPLVIIGAARSGTNILRDTLTHLPGFETWDCDEINAIWRYGNTDWPNDEIPADRAHGRVRIYIRQRFWKLWRKSGEPAFVVEKTCANSLRVPFVNSILPEAKYIHIVRNGIDVVASARKRWKGEMEIPSIPYLLAKAKYVPLRDVPAYGIRFIRSRMGLIGRQKRFSSWGPRFSGMDAYAGQGLEVLCAKQWAMSVKASHDDLASLDSTRVHVVQYEKFVANPAQELARILDFLRLSVDDSLRDAAVEKVTGGSVGKGMDSSILEDDVIREILTPALKLYGYI